MAFAGRVANARFLGCWAACRFTLPGRRLFENERISNQRSARASALASCKNREETENPDRVLLATSRRKIPNRGERSVAAVRQRWEGVLELLDQCGRIVEWKKGGKVRPGVEEERSGFLLVGQVGADVYHLNYARGLPFGAYSAITACPPDSVQPSLISA